MSLQHNKKGMAKASKLKFNGNLNIEFPFFYRFVSFEY